MVKYHDDRKSIMGYNTSHTRFFQVYVSMPTMIPQLKRIMDEGITLPGMYESTSLQPFETNVPFVLRFMIDQEITGAGWLSLPANSYRLRPESEKKTHCQLELDISYKEIVARKPEGEWSKVAPLRVLSFDIECQGRKGYFPEAEKDPVIQIANCVSVYGDKVRQRRASEQPRTTGSNRAVQSAPPLFTQCGSACGPPNTRFARRRRS